MKPASKPQFASVEQPFGCRRARARGAGVSRVVTAFDEEARNEFQRLKRRKWASWELVVAGEWSQSPDHEGKQKFAVRSTADRRTRALFDAARERSKA